MMIVNYILSTLYIVYFFFMLFLFHPIQWIAYTIFGQAAHRNTVDLLNFFLLRGSHLVGSRIQFKAPKNLPKNTPLILIANHQSMYDIIGIIWFFRKLNPIFVSKASLAKGIPSISYNLRNSKAALINRSDRGQALSAIAKLGEYIEENNFSAVIFPEGTRSRKGLRKFSTGGIKGLLDNAPSAHILPITVNGTGKMDAYKVYPVNSFIKLSWTALETFDPKGMTAAEVAAKAKEMIQAELLRQDNTA